MKAGSILTIAWRNLKRRRKAAFSLVSGVLIITLLVIIWTVFHAGIERLYEEYLIGSKASFKLERTLTIGENGEITLDEDYRAMRRATPAVSRRRASRRGRTARTRRAPPRA